MASPSLSLWASGSGSNVERIVTWFRAQYGDLAPRFTVLYNTQNAFVAERAAQLGCEAYFFSKAALREVTPVMDYLKETQAQGIVLAGFLQLVPAGFVQQFPNRIINIHPSLLPHYSGKGMYGRYVHQAVHDNQESRSGITVHYVNEVYDEGEVLLQASCQITPSDLPLDIARKVQELEHRYYPLVVDGLWKQIVADQAR